MRKANVSVLRNWLREGRTNPWIKHAEDPKFSEESFVECNNVVDIMDKFSYGNYCLGQGFYIGDVCFINQDNGGDEWLVIKGKGKNFESITTYGFKNLKGWIRRLVDLDKKEGFSGFIEYTQWLKTLK